MKDEHLKRDWYMINHHQTEGSIMLLGNCVNSFGENYVKSYFSRFKSTCDSPNLPQIDNTKYIPH